MIGSYAKMLDLLDGRERRRLIVLLLIMVLMSASEVFGISTLLVLLNLLSDPAEAIEGGLLGWLYQSLGFESLFRFQVALALATLVAVIASIGVRALGTYAIVRFSKMRGFTISSRLLESYLHQPYTWFLQRNSSEISRNVLQESEGLVNRVMIPGLQIIASALLAVSMVIFMLAVDPIVTLAAAAGIGLTYFLIFGLVRRVLRTMGRAIYEANERRFQLTQESMGGFKEIKLHNLEGAYSERFREPARIKARLEARTRVIEELPRFATEAVAFAGMLAMILVFLFRNDGNLLSAIPTLGVFAFAALRLMPTAQMIFRSVAALENSRTMLHDIHENYVAARADQARRALAPFKGAPLELDKVLELRDVSFGYPGAQGTTLNDFSLSIGARTTVGLVGGTGAGKTTVVDLILGLLPQAGGSLLVDGTEVTNANLRNWQRSIGYVPQTIYLVDDTVAQNIAFGVAPEQIDRAAVERAARAASLHDFVMSDLAQGYDTIVGERGVRLSGGQRQRIGIARALYRAPSLLVMDEATSALDTITERVVMEAIGNLRDDITIILIAHRLSTVRNCDAIHLLNRGQIVASGTYDELVDGSDEFRRMASAG